MERADLTKPPARPFQVADRRLGRESGACAHDIPSDKDISGLAAGGSDGIPPCCSCWRTADTGLLAPSCLAQGGLVIMFLTKGAGTSRTFLPGLGACRQGAVWIALSPINGHSFLLGTAGTFLVYYAQFFFLSPFPGAGHLSIIDTVREIKLEKVTWQ